MDFVNRESLFLLNIKLPLEYQDWVNDLSKFFIVLVTIHVLQYMTAGTTSERVGLFNPTFWRLVLFMAIGFSAYHLVFRKLIRFRYISDDVAVDSSAVYTATFTPFGFFDRIREWLKSRL